MIELLWIAARPLWRPPGGAYPHHMWVPIRLAALCAAALAALALLAGAAAAQEADSSVPQRIFADYARDHAIAGSSSPHDLDRALEIAGRESDASFGEFEAAVADKYDRDILGLDVSGPAASDDGSLLPVPTAPGERDQPPWPFLALTALAAALVLTGAGSSIYRRARR